MNVGSTAVDAVKIAKSVPEGLVRLHVVDTGSDTTTSGDSNGNNSNNGTASSDKMQGVSVSEVTVTSIDIPLQPVSIRMRVPRSNSLIVNHWNELDSASNSTELFNIFSRYGTVWVRSEATRERDANLFTAINNKGSNIGVSAADCVRAFLYNDELYLDFIVIMADGSSVKTSKTAYVEVFKDDDVPYILIGDGNEDGKWDFTFYISSLTAGSTSEGIADPDAYQNTTPNTNTNTNTNTNNGTSQGVGGSSGGGGCNISAAISALMLAGIFLLMKKR